MTYPFVLIVGPTASGKSALGLALAQRFGGVILNCDSLQAYVGLDIGTAKPDATDRSRVPHFLFDTVKPKDLLTAGDFRREALQVLGRELKRVPVFGVGGSGFYIQALENGMFDVPKPDARVEAQVRADLAGLSNDAIYARLRDLDPAYAATLNVNDHYRVTRALILIADAGRTVTEVRRGFQPQPFPFPLLKLGLRPTREWLEPRVRARTKAMLDAGLLDEVRRLLAAGLGDWPPLQSVGYRECVRYLQGEISGPELEPLIVEKTLQLAKKQRSWFKRDAATIWLPQDDPFTAAVKAIGEFAPRLDPLK